MRTPRCARQPLAAVLAALVMLTLAGCADADAPGAEAVGAASPATASDPATATESATADAPSSDDTAAAAYAARGAWALGDVVHVGEVEARLDGTVEALALTSAGAVAMAGPDGGATTTWLVRPDGSTRRLTLPEAAWAGDLGGPRVAWAEQRPDGFALTVWDVVADRAVATLRLPVPRYGFGDLDPVTPIPFDGDTAYVPTPTRSLLVNWRTGRSETVEGDVISSRGGVTVTEVDDRFVVRRGTRVLRRLDAFAGDGGAAVTPAPGGRVVLTNERGRRTLLDLADGSARPLPVGPSAVWTPDGHVLGQRIEATGRASIQHCDRDARCVAEPAPGADDDHFVVLPAPPPAG